MIATHEVNASRLVLIDPHGTAHDRGSLKGSVSFDEPRMNELLQLAWSTFGPSTQATAYFCQLR